MVSPMIPKAMRHIVLAVALAHASVGEEEWFCNSDMPWEECRDYLPSEHAAMRRFLRALEQTNAPPPGSLQGRGIVMSGGQGHVLQALANLRVLREYAGSSLPVEFWHAYELGDAHCEMLAALGATCRALQVPGVYPTWQTTLPAIMSSAFREVLWIDTDITPLVQPERLFETATYRREGALFWPDLWGMGCEDFGQSAWPWHVSWHVLGLAHNASDFHCSHEHEAGHLLIDKSRHWRPLCLANYLSTRDFFTRVLHGYKDVFRLAWLKLNASGWLSPVRPGLVGGFARDGRFVPGGLVHFWPAHGERAALGASSWPRALYLHQKKTPGHLWQEVVTFPEPLGECVRYGVAPFFPDKAGVKVWQVNERHQKLAVALGVTEEMWNIAYWEGHRALQADARLTDTEKRRLHPVSAKRTRATREFNQMVRACRCEYSNNRWFALITGLQSRLVGDHLLRCDEVLRPGLRHQECTVGFAAAALGCSQRYLDRGDALRAREAVGVVAALAPVVASCLPHSFWPVRLEELQAFLGVAARPGNAVEDLAWQGEFRIPSETLARFPRSIRRCLPLRDLACWSHTQRQAGADELQIVPESSCLFCCDPFFRQYAWQKECFDSEYTEERCCNPVPT